MKRLLRRLPLIVFALALVGSLVYAFQPTPLGVDLATVKRGPLRITVDEDGKTRIKERYIISAPLTGELERIKLKPGARVEKYSTVITTIKPTMLDPRARGEAEAKVKAAEASLERARVMVDRAREAERYAKIEHDRLKGLLIGQGVSRQDLDNAALKERTVVEEMRAAEFAVDVAKYEMEQANAVLLRFESSSNGKVAMDFPIVSPIKGKVLRVIQESATVVNPGTQLLEVGNPDELEIEIDVLSSDAVKIKEKDRVILEHWGGKKPLEAQVRLVEPSGFTKISALGVEEQRVNVIADFVDPPEKRKTLGDAFRVEARIVILEKENVLQVPSSALFRHDGGKAVFVLKDGKAELRPVKVGEDNGQAAEILEGLEEDEQVVIHPSDKIKPGVAIELRGKK